MLETLSSILGKGSDPVWLDAIAFFEDVQHLRLDLQHSVIFWLGVGILVARDDYMEVA